MSRQRIKETRTTTDNGTVVVRRKIVEAPELEWVLQAAAVRRIRTIPGYAAEWTPSARFTLAGDFNAGRRSRQESIKAAATGLTAGEADLRLYFTGGSLKMIEFKGARTPVSRDQMVRHELLDGLGFDIVIVRAKTEMEAADAAEALVRAWLAGAVNDNHRGA